MSTLPSSAQRVQEAAGRLLLDISIIEMDESTRTAEDAAAACGCDVARIVKSLIFRGAETGEPYLLLVSGANRVNEKRVSRRIGEKLERPDADFVRETTGFAIGGVAPIAHAIPLKTFMDESLLGYDTVWAAAGTPKCLFSVSPTALSDAISPTIMDVT